MMVRTQISLTKAQHERLRRVSKVRGVSISTVIREAVDAAVPDPDAEWLERRRRAFALAGAFRSGYADTSARHDEILAQEKRW